MHNLRRLAEMTGTVSELSREDMKKIDFLSQYYLNARYKEDIEELAFKTTADVAKDFISFVMGKIQWLTQKIRP